MLCRYLLRFGVITGAVVVLLPPCAFAQPGANRETAATQLATDEGMGSSPHLVGASRSPGHLVDGDDHAARTAGRACRQGVFHRTGSARLRAAGGRADQSRSARRRRHRGCRTRLQRLLVGHRHARRADATNLAHHRSARRPRAAAHARGAEAVGRASRRRASSAVPRIIQRTATCGSAASRAACPM